MKLYDTLTRQEQPLAAADGRRLRMYVCGPTVYGPSHIGNFRTFVLCDVLRRTAQVAGLEPFYVRNITDIDDKTIKGAREEGSSLRDFTQRWIDAFHEDCGRLNLIQPDVEPAATDHIREQVALIETLIEKGHAYVGGDGSVYYRVRSFEEYGKLSHFDPEDLRTQATTISGAANVADEYDRDQIADFALWKAQRPEDGDNYWDGPRDPQSGDRIPGRPGWHLECSAMSMKYLGESFDLHAGGEDLCFPHHENEIAQSEAATGKTFVRHWMHCVHLLVEGKKMSKSLGNFYTLRDLMEKGHSARSVRFLLISGHYRQQLNFTISGLHSADSALKRLDRAVASLLDRTGEPLEDFLARPPADAQLVRNSRFAPVIEALFDDLNTPEAIGALFTSLKSLSDPSPDDLPALATVLFALGVQPQAQVAEEAPQEIRELAERRWQAKAGRDFAQADALRNQIQDAGWKVLDSKEGWKLERL